ncbi:hypothetical protein A3Q56_01396 [Intoshia linei]|uniref:Uncharacterized protein n=1 Tax=Intoshia linei TaxID=1819745 RepID=A0A177B8W2_9BILA|nr:hypothetical protein A3Q56_01396 [Intoshia linei]
MHIVSIGSSIKTSNDFSSEMGEEIPSENRNKIDALYLTEMERIKKYCINKLILIIMDETDLNGYKYINTMIGTLETPQNVILYDCKNSTSNMNGQMIIHTFDDTIKNN